MDDKTITELPGGGSLQPEDVFPISRGFNNTLKIEGSSIIGPITNLETKTTELSNTILNKVRWSDFRC
jgi:hypothetical protein